MIKLLVTPGSEFNDALEVIRGVNVHDKVTGQVLRQMKPVTELAALSPGLGQVLQMVNAGASVVNLGVSLASFSYMREQFNGIASYLDDIQNNLNVIMAKVDARYEAEVFADVAAVIDALKLSDTMEGADAKSFIMSNYVPLMQALRRFESYIDERKGDKGQYHPSSILLMELNGFVMKLELRALLALGQTQEAAAKASKYLGFVRSVAETFAENCIPPLLLGSVNRDELDTVVAELGRLTGDSVETILRKGLNSLHAPVLPDEVTIPPALAGYAFRMMYEVGIPDRFVDRFSERLTSSISDACDPIIRTRLALMALDEQHSLALGAVLETEFLQAGQPLLDKIDCNSSTPFSLYHIVDNKALEFVPA